MIACVRRRCVDVAGGGVLERVGQTNKKKKNFL